MSKRISENVEAAGSTAPGGFFRFSHLMPTTTQTTSTPVNSAPATNTPATTAAPATDQQPTNHNNTTNPITGSSEGIPMTITEIHPQPPSTTASFGTPVAFANGNAVAATTSEDWQAAALCRIVEGADTVFFSEELQDIAAAKRVCAECPVIAPCLEGAISRGEPWGVWGGQLFANGRILANKRRRGRPPKNPRPEDFIPDVPIPAHLQRLIA